jgi:hypothetical protein
LRSCLGDRYEEKLQITGHRTISVFNRYDITAAEDMTAALEKTVQYRAG